MLLWLVQYEWQALVNPVRRFRSFHSISHSRSHLFYSANPLLHPALPGHRSYPIFQLSSNLCRHLSHWLLKVLADERHPLHAPLLCLSHLFTALLLWVFFLALLSHDAISRQLRKILDCHTIM
uniref:Uncharacterized protein n=1 Tax=Utricularia reniformis TaxID=192314 RepID=A0A1Y0B312_9LAMI|nr:hypothetical protein AEK19_MT1641 [Utricularia reniformis]ART31825.1 hypothetical protein AEK19_MT1641 [Utricularia reniformis]